MAPKNIPHPGLPSMRGMFFHVEALHFQEPFCTVSALKWSQPSKHSHPSLTEKTKPALEWSPERMTESISRQISMRKAEGWVKTLGCSWVRTDPDARDRRRVGTWGEFLWESGPTTHILDMFSESAHQLPPFIEKGMEAQKSFLTCLRLCGP